MTPPALDDLGRLKTFLETMSEDELRNFLDGTMNAAIVAQDVFARNYPDRYAAWEELVNLPSEGRLQ
jgi:hypothetical protein